MKKLLFVLLLGVIVIPQATEIRGWGGKGNVPITRIITADEGEGLKGEVPIR